MDEAEIRSKWEAGALNKVCTIASITQSQATPTVSTLKPGSPPSCSPLPDLFSDTCTLLTWRISTAPCRPAQGSYLIRPCDAHGCDVAGATLYYYRAPHALPSAKSVGLAPR